MKELLLIDANSLIHRAFHALPPLTSKKGEPSGALYGLSSILLKTLKERKPDFVAAAFDRPETTFRKEMFEDYKATRPKAPDELISQIVEARETFKAFGIKTFERAGFEADDIIGTFAEKFGEHDGINVIILTGDLDTLQLVNGDKIAVEILKKGVSETAYYNEAAVIERYGLPPRLLADYKGLVGDKSDNIPGVRSVGPKTAEKLIKDYGGLEAIFNGPRPDDRVAEKILPERDTALLSKRLATIDRSVPINAELDDLAFKADYKTTIKKYFERWDFDTLSRRLAPETVSIAKPAPENDTASLNAFFVPPNGELNQTGHLSKNYKVAWEWKPIIKTFIKENKEVPKNIFDISVAYWLTHPDSFRFSKEEVVKKTMGREAASDDSDWKNLFLILKNKIDKNGLGKIFHELEMPLVEILAQMELTGIKIDKEAAETVSRELGDKLDDVSKEIFEEAGFSFNLNSPKQVSSAIFDNLKIKPTKNKKTKSGQLSTSFGNLSSMKGMKIVDLLMEYRETFKMKSTYLEPILSLTAGDGRLRTTFVQTGTATGRLSSEKPNLQNIPQESSWSKKIRDVFVAEEGWSLVSFDYSQLELRLLADASQDQKLKEAFLKDEDIHRATASEIFGVPESKVTKEERRIGKTLNFGMVYGMGARAFSETAGIKLKEAENFIKKYFEMFPGIKKWQEETKLAAENSGFAEDKNGRKRWFGEPFSQKIRSENERAAVNMPIQGLGADILKRAMINSINLLRKNAMENKAKAILTIHDELLFEIRDDILMETIPQIKESMESAQKLSVPLKIGVKRGKKWGSMENYEP